MKDKFIKLIRFVVIIICVLLSISLVNNIIRSRQMQSSLAEAERSLQEIKANQSQLKSEILTIEDDFFLEREARNKLGLVKENEIVIVLPDDEILRKLSSRKENADSYELPEANWRKWLNLFI